MAGSNPGLTAGVPIKCRSSDLVQVVQVSAKQLDRQSGDLQAQKTRIGGRVHLLA